jgi:predicted nucleotidyltransferase
VDFIEPIGWEIVDLKDYLENILGLSVDLITRNAALNKKNFWEIIKNEIHYV